MRHLRLILLIALPSAQSSCVEEIAQCAQLHYQSIASGVNIFTHPNMCKSVVDAYCDAKPGGGALPPICDNNICVLEPDNKNITVQAINQFIIDTAYARLGGFYPYFDYGQFSEERIFLYFKSGDFHNLQVPVGYYTHISGHMECTDGANCTKMSTLKNSPTGFYVVPTNFRSEGFVTPNGDNLDSFWRIVENFNVQMFDPPSSSSAWAAPPSVFSTGADGGKRPMVYAVSQASPLRNLDIVGDLWLFTVLPVPPYAGTLVSGGYSAHLTVTGGEMNFGAQQQWFDRDSSFETIKNFPVWNYVQFMSTGTGTNGCKVSEKMPHPANGGNYWDYGWGWKGQTTTYGNASFASSVKHSLLPREKPFVIRTDADEWNVGVPTDSSYDRVTVRKDVTIVYPNATAESISAMIAKGGTTIVFAPGIYKLASAIKVEKPDVVLLGLGMATLQINYDGPAINAKSSELRVANFVVEAVHDVKDAMVVIHNSGEKPAILSDVFFRTGIFYDSQQGGPLNVNVMLQLEGENIIVDNMWLWRADHVPGMTAVADASNTRHALLNNAKRTAFYGLAAEHTLDDIVVFNEDDAHVFFYQAEMPYDPTLGVVNPDMVGYRVASNVTSHKAFGVGIYYFPTRVDTFTQLSIARGKAEFFHSYITFVHLNGKGWPQCILYDETEGTCYNVLSTAYRRPPSSPFTFVTSVQKANTDTISPSPTDMVMTCSNIPPPPSPPGQYVDYDAYLESL